MEVKEEVEDQKTTRGCGVQSRPTDFSLTVDLLFLVILILNGSKVDSSFIGEKESIRSEVFVTSEKDSVEHGFVEEEVTHPLLVSERSNVVRARKWGD